MGAGVDVLMEGNESFEEDNSRSKKLVWNLGNFKSH